MFGVECIGLLFRFMLRVQPCFSSRYCWLMGHLELGIVQYIWLWHLHYSLYYLRTLTSVNIWVIYLLQSSNSDQPEI